nr:DNA N-6-adenine-methyltransferase [Romboutsia sp. 1001713B170207_170306_H8]
MFSSKDQTWETPIEFFNKVNEEFKFDIDVCAVDETAKYSNYYTPEVDGLKQEWKGVCWMNPPYVRQIGKWIEKAYNESVKGATVVCLIPARTDTKYWHEFIFPYASEIRFIKGRLKFGNSDNSAPFPSALVILSNKIKELNVTVMSK